MSRTPRDPSYLAFLRRQNCASCGCWPPSEASHHGRHGIGIKASDYEAIPLCRSCHAHWHQRGRLPRFSGRGPVRERQKEWLAARAKWYKQLYDGSTGQAKGEDHGADDSSRARDANQSS